MIDMFWKMIELQLARIRLAQNVDEVVEILGKDPNLAEGSADAFFAGSGGETQLWEALMDGGWMIDWNGPPYVFSAYPPSGGPRHLLYVEGDVYIRKNGKED